MHGDHTTKYQTDMPVQDLRETLSRLAPGMLSSRFAPPTREKEEVHSSIRPPFTSVPLTQPVRLPPIVVEVTKRLLKVLQHNCIPRTAVHSNSHRKVLEMTQQKTGGKNGIPNNEACGYRVDCGE
nr:GATA transcription factor 1 isoform X2 [Ipomoea batatas]